MKYNPKIHHRRSLRLKDYDYSWAGAYFVTICTQNKLMLLEPEPVQSMIKRVWDELPKQYPGIELDEFVVMPNHVHGIIVLNPVGATPRGCPFSGQAQGPAPTKKMKLGDVVHRFKSFTTAEYRHGVKHFDWPSFPGRLWQRNYYERVIRHEDELNTIRQYIIDNPLSWDEDPENPNNLL